MAPHRLQTAAAATGVAALAYVAYREIRHLVTRPRKLEILGRVVGRFQRADLDQMVRCDAKRLRRMVRALLLGAEPERVSDERLRRAFLYAHRPDHFGASSRQARGREARGLPLRLQASREAVDRYVALAKTCSRALDEEGDHCDNAYGEPELGPDPPFSLPLPRVVAWALRALAPGVARASEAWLAKRRLRKVVRRGGVVWLERGGDGTPWLVLHGVAGLFCAQYDALAQALGDERPVRVPLHPNLGDATDFSSESNLSIAGFAAAIAAALDGSVDVLAVSIGTSVAAALMRGGRVRRSVYVDPVAFAPCGADAWRLFFERPLAVARTLRRRRLRLAAGRAPYSFEHESRAFRLWAPAAVVDGLYALLCCSDVCRVVCRVNSYGRCTEACLPPLANRPPTLVLVDDDDALTCAAEHIDHFEAFPRTQVVRARGFHGSWLLNPRLADTVSTWTTQIDADEAAVDAILAPAQFGARL